MNSTPLWTAEDLARVAGVEWKGVPTGINGITYRPDRVKPGDLFVALNYEGVDHHRSIPEAARRGAVAALVSRMPEDAGGLPLLLTTHMRRSLMQLGAYARDRAKGKFVGITGRAGKTFTKDTLSYVLAAQGKTYATRGNDNDTTGVAITLAGAAPDNQYNVIEISMALSGDAIAESVRPKSLAAKPHVAIVTMISGGDQDSERYRAHHREVAYTKAQIFEGLTPGGSALINRDDAHVFDYLLERAKASPAGHVYSFGTHPDADIRLIEASRTPDGLRVRVDICGRELEFVIGVNGRHLVMNCLAVLGAVHALGADVEAAARLLREVHESPGRGNRYRVAAGGGSALLLDYTRNATLPGVHASLVTLVEMPTRGSGRRIAVLGDLGELGDDPAPFHRDLAGTIERLGIDLVFAVGEQIRHMYDALPPEKRGGTADTSDVLAGRVRETVRDGDVIMAQGMRKLRLNRIVQALAGKENYIPWA